MISVNAPACPRLISGLRDTKDFRRVESAKPGQSSFIAVGAIQSPQMLRRPKLDTLQPTPDPSSRPDYGDNPHRILTKCDEF
jgi:hypothetical protein